MLRRFAFAPLTVCLASGLALSACAESEKKPPVSDMSPSEQSDAAVDTPRSTVPGHSVQVFQTSRAGDKLADKGKIEVYTRGEGERTVVAIDGSAERQEILGFGGALTESSASVLAQLPKAKRQEVIDAYYGAGGAGYTIARTHIASCDFSVASYQYSLEPDPALADFSIDHDKAELIPLLKDAIASAGGELKVVAAPWSAPAWMKSPTELFVKPAASNNYAGVDPILQPQYYDAYALYLSKYIKAYKAEGIDIWGLSPQNEPLGNGGNWETMRWDPVSMRNFIRDNLGPRLEADGIDTHIMIYDHNKGPVEGDAVKWAKVILSDPEAAKYVWGTATHWYGSTNKVFEESLDAIHEVDPTRAILATEQTIDGLSDRKAMPPSPAYQDSWLKDDFYWTKSAYDWGYWWATGDAVALHPVYEPVYRYARDIIVGLNHWYAGWIDWNVVLDSTGGPNHQNNLCAAPVMVDTEKQAVFYSPLFYVMSHFSKFILPKAHVLATTVELAPSLDIKGYDGKRTDGLIATASKNPDGSHVVVLFNQTAKPIDYQVELGGTVAEGKIDAQALQTLVWTTSD
jgi:glucosylceramidase